MPGRATPTELADSAVGALEHALVELGVRVSRTGPEELRVDVDGADIRLEVHAASVLDHGRAQSLLRHAVPASGDRVPIVVADKITAPARDELATADRSWFDRRGRVRLRAPGVLLDADVAPQPRESAPRRATQALAGRSGHEVACALLLDPEVDPPGVRALARDVGLAPSSISRTLTELRASGLVRRDGRAVLPDLFWALSEHWHPVRRALATEPAPDDARVARLGASVGDLEQPGWAVSDTRGALAWGAPAVAGANTPAALYVADDATLRAVIHEWGEGREADTSGPSVSIAPVRAITTTRVRRPHEPWPVAHPLFVALDLATDRSRGHQILDEWEPQEVTRVW